MTNYAAEQDDWMPPGDLNTFAALALFIGKSVDGPEGGDVFRCPIHEWLPRKDRERYASYAFNVSLDEDENDTYSPFSVARTGRWKRFGGTAPDTILAIEMWMRPRPDGTFPNQLRLDDPNWSLITAGVVPISSYTSAETATFDANGRLVDPGPYRFLDGYKGTDIPVDAMYHHGRINLLLADGSVAQEDILTFTGHSPKDDPRWTRQRDTAPGRAWDEPPSRIEE